MSSDKQKEDLGRQIANMQTYLLAQGKPFEIISDIGSGINYERKGLQEIIKGMANRSISKVDRKNRTRRTCGRFSADYN